MNTVYCILETNNLIGDNLSGKVGHVEYTSPEIFEVGRALELVQSGSYGKYNDGYTGYYWER